MSGVFTVIYQRKLLIEGKHYVIGISNRVIQLTIYLSKENSFVEDKNEMQ